MTDPKTTRSFLKEEIEALEPFDFVLARPSGTPLHVVEVTRREDRELEIVFGPDATATVTQYLGFGEARRLR